MNEATAPWWIPDGTQEGCHFSRGAKDQAAVLLQRALELEGFSATSAANDTNQQRPVIAAFDENSYDDALRAWRMMSPAAKQFVGQVRLLPCYLASCCMEKLRTSSEHSRIIQFSTVSQSCFEHNLCEFVANVLRMPFWWTFFRSMCMDTSSKAVID